MLLHLACALCGKESRVHWHAFLQELGDPAADDTPLT